MKKLLFKRFVELSGNPASSAVLKTIASSRLSRKLIKPFARAYRIDEGEAEFPIDHYHSLQSYFTRKLQKGSRPIDMRSNILISPVDGVVTEMGTINENQTFMIKNYLYSIKKILGDEK
jgi:phosphatidylserine decarboxylase